MAIVALLLNVGFVPGKKQLVSLQALLVFISRCFERLEVFGENFKTPKLKTDTHGGL